MKVKIAILLLLPLLLPTPSDSRAQRTAGPAKAAVTFEEVPPRASGINWVHNNAMSPERS